MHNEDQLDDMYWLIADANYVIQGIDAINAETILPIGFKVSEAGKNSITIDELSNLPEGLTTLIYDKELEIIHTIEESDYDFYADPGVYAERFELVFQQAEETEEEVLIIEEITYDALDVHFTNSNEKVVLVNPKEQQIDKIELLNLLGQTLMTINNIPTQIIAEFDAKGLSTGAYIIRIHTINSQSISKKVLIE